MRFASLEDDEIAQLHGPKGRSIIRRHQLNAAMARSLSPEALLAIKRHLRRQDTNALIPASEGRSASRASSIMMVQPFMFTPLGHLFSNTSLLRTRRSSASTSQQPHPAQQAPAPRFPPVDDAAGGSSPPPGGQALDRYRRAIPPNRRRSSSSPAASPRGGGDDLPENRRPSLSGLELTLGLAGAV